MKPASKIIHLILRVLLLLIFLYAVVWWLIPLVVLAFIYEYVQGKYSLPDLTKKYITDAENSIKDIFNYLKI